MSNADVVVLTTNLVSRYHSEQCQSDLLAPFLRSLNTSTFSGRPCAPYLEQPNVISGLAAQSEYTVVVLIMVTDSYIMDNAFTS